MLLQTSRVTRIDLTLDVHSKRFLRNYYFSIPNARTGRNFLGNEDDCKNNYAIGSQRSSSYLLVYEKLKFQEVEDVYQNNLIVKREHIKRSITPVSYTHLCCWKFSSKIIYLILLIY